MPGLSALEGIEREGNTRSFASTIIALLTSDLLMIIRPAFLPRWRTVGAVFTAASLLTPVMPLEARNRKGDRLLREAQIAESKQVWDDALTLAEQAVTSDPADPAYQLEFRRVRFEAANYHLLRGQEIRPKGDLAGALAEFEKAYKIDPASDIADQEARRTRLMIQREANRKAADPSAKVSPEEMGMTTAQVARQAAQERVDSLMPIPELRPLNTQPLTLRMTNQKPKVLFDTLGKLAGVNVLFDPDFDGAQTKPQSIDLNGSTLEEALDYLAVVTHSFWKPLGSNTIFIAQENPTKRRDYEDQVVKVFYLSNITSPQELQEVITTLRQVIEVNKLFNYSSQNAIIVRAEPARMALVEKIIADLDKPKAEVLVDVTVMEVDTTRSRQLAAAFAPNGINSQILFTPRTSLQTLAGQLGTTNSNSGGFNANGGSTGSTGSSTGSNTGSGTGSNTGTTNTSGSSSTTTTSSPIPLVNLKHITSQDYSLTNVPGGLLEAIMNDTGTRVMQRPQIRAVDNFKAVLKIGDKVPTASGSFQPGVGGVGVNPLVNTQFTYIDTGVNLEMTPRVHDNGEVSMHLDIDISQVSDYVNLGGISQPVISQRKATLDVRMRDGQINMIGGLIQLSDSKNVSGVPGLANIPILNRLFTTLQTTQNKTELLISIVPHIVRGPDVTAENLKEVYAGNQTNYSVRRAARAVPASTTVTVPLPNSEMGAPPAPAVLPSPAPRISFSPAQLDAQSGSSFTVSVRADSVTNLQSIESQIKFDPKVLKINSIVAGDLLQQNGLTLTPSKNILNDTGDASASLARDPAKGGVNGSGALLTVTFQAVGKGQTVVIMPRTVLHDAAGATVNAGSGPLTVTVK